MAGTDPGQALEGARSIIVCCWSCTITRPTPRSWSAFFGRCYLDDDRVTKDGLARRMKAFRSFLEDSGMRVKYPPYLPQRPAAARAGLGDYGKNCLLYANRVARGGSWVLPLPFVVDAELTPGAPTEVVGCPEWCKNACLTACPTGALKGPRNLDPRRCISYLTYFGDGLTPLDMREPMGLYVYGCDRLPGRMPAQRPLAGRGPGAQPPGGGQVRRLRSGKAAAHGCALFQAAHLAAHVLHAREGVVALAHERGPGHGQHPGRGLRARAGGGTGEQPGRAGAGHVCLGPGPHRRAARRGGALEARRGQDNELVNQEVEQALGMLG